MSCGGHLMSVPVMTLEVSGNPIWVGLSLLSIRRGHHDMLNNTITVYVKGLGVFYEFF